VRLVVVDSISYLFQFGIEDLATRSRILASATQSLLSTADKYNIAVSLIPGFQQFDLFPPNSINSFRHQKKKKKVVLMNQVSTRIEGEVSMLVPSLGESFGHNSTNRVVLYWKNLQRYAMAIKSSLPYFAPQQHQQQQHPTAIPFTILPEGIRSVTFI